MLTTVYREQWQRFGLRGGPYSGPPKTFAQRALPPYLVERLRGVVQGSGHPEPILKRDVPSGRGGQIAAAAVFTASAGVLALVARTGFGEAARLTQGPALAASYAGGVVVMATCCLFLWRARRGLLRRTGAYLLPLDVLEVGRDTVTVTPLGGLRKATIEGAGGSLRLALTFEHGARHEFPLASGDEAQRAYARLEHSQQTLEGLSASTDLEVALDLDPFFTLRGTGGGAREVGRWDLPPAGRTPQIALALTVVLGLTLGVGLWWLRNLASDQTLFDRTVAANTVEAYRGYLAVGRLRRGAAIAWLAETERLAQLRAEAERFHENERRVAKAGEAEAARAACEPMVVSGADAAQSVACYQRRATTARPEVAAWLARRIREGVPLKVGVRRASPPSLDAHLAGREQRVFEVLRQIVAEVVPGTVMPVVRSSPEDADLRITVAVTPGTNELATVYAFDVVLASTSAAFHLTLPAATKQPELRARSLYTLREGGAGGVGRDAELMSARAYDRFYDELYGLFFDGNPRVPLPAVSPR